MKKFKKLAAFVLALGMACAMGITVFAETTTYSITIKDVDSANHTYEAYQVFSGDFSSNTLSNIAWGDGMVADTTEVDSKTIYQALAEIEDTSDSSYPFTDGSGAPLTSAGEVAEALENYSSNSDVVQKFADVIEQYLTTDADNYTTSTTYTTETSNGVTSYTYTISGLEAGYYFVKDKDGSVASTSAYTDYILKVADDTEIEVKSTVPQLDKVISADTQQTYVNGTETNNVSIGDTVTYTLTSYVPDTSAYNKYYYIIHDTMDKGLTFDPTSVTITIGEGTNLKTLECKAVNGEAVDPAPSTGYTYELDYETDDTTGETTITIVLNNFIQYTTANEDIIITYQATLNGDAVVGTKGNENNVYLEYSNNPNYDYNGDDKPGSDEPTGKTPEEKTITYVSGIKLIKVDNSNPENALTGAEFTITGTTVNKVVVTKTVYVEDASDGTYYKLTDGTYTTTEPTADTASYYEDTNTKYSPTTVVTVENRTDNGSSYSVTSYVDADGYLILTGLSAGTYTITETVTPEGYNTISPITVTIDWTAPGTGEEECTWTATATHVNGTMTPNTDGVFEIKIVNEKGTVLPSTGGIGTTIFYVVGAILVFGSAVLLITRRRMRNS